MAQVEDKDIVPSPEKLDVFTAKNNKNDKASPSLPSPSWLVGDVVWSKIPGHPWWPSMVSYDPNLTIYYQRKGRATYYHVQFFGQVPVRGWASERSVIKFEGITNYMYIYSLHNLLAYYRLFSLYDRLKNSSSYSAFLH